MTNIKEKLKKAVEDLLVEGKNLLTYESLNQRARTAESSTKVIYSSDPEKNKRFVKIKNDADKRYKDFHTAYQNWYSKSSITLKQIMPDRYDEFVDCYKSSPKRKDVALTNYTISDYLSGVTRRDWEASIAKGIFELQFRKQIAIFNSCLERLDSILSDIQGALQANLFDSELDAAKDLSKNKHLRAAGALAGVTLERHFTTVATNHGINISKKNPTISDFNEEFKRIGVYDIPTYRRILYLGDIRNLSSHLKDREPTKEEIEEMIIGVDKILRTIF